MTTALYPLHQTFESKLSNFDDAIYPMDEHQHITKLMRVLLEDSGVGHLSKVLCAGRLAESLGGTQFSELDYFFGTFLQLPRMASEMYAVDPFTDQLTSSQWRDVRTKDASYRERLSLFLQAIIRGGTNDGLAMAAEAASGVPCAVLEVWRYTDLYGLGTNPGRVNVGGTPREVVIVPKTAGTLTNSQRRAIYGAVNRLQPVNVVITVDENGLSVRQTIVVRHIASPSEYFEVRKYVTGVNSPSQPAIADRYFWVRDGIQVEAPTFADLQTMENQWQYNSTVTNVEAFELGPTGLSSRLPPRLDPIDQQWGQWREIELADSPDNYPNGKYQGQAGKVDDNGNYVFAWGSQMAYVNWLTTWVIGLSGEVAGDRYRLPVTAEVSYGELSSPEDALAPYRVTVRSMYYGR